MNRPTLTAVLATGLAAGSLAAAAPAAAASIDRTQATCGAALVSATFERDGRDREIDVEVESAPGERWTFVVRASGGTSLVRLSGVTNRDGDWDAWRYLPTRPDTVRVTARGPAGESCTMRLSLRP